MAKKKKKRLKPVDPLQIFGNAHRFAMTAKLLDQKKEPEIYKIPAFVNEAFAVELFLKALHRIRRRRPFGHDLHTLFHELSKSD